MKVYLLKQEDLDQLLLAIDRDPKHGPEGGSSQAQVRDKQQDKAYDEAHAFYNYQVRRWISKVQE